MGPLRRAYIEELLPDVLEGRIEPGRVFDRLGRLDEVPNGYRVMNDRCTIPPAKSGRRFVAGAGAITIAEQ